MDNYGSVPVAGIGGGDGGFVSSHEQKRQKGVAFFGARGKRSSSE